MTMAPLQRFQLWSQKSFFDDAETDDDFVDLQVPTVPLQDHDNDHGLETKLTLALQLSTTKKTVSFSMSNDVCIIENKTSLSEQEKEQIWYDKKDYARFKDSCRRIIEWISHRNHPHQHHQQQLQQQVGSSGRAWEDQDGNEDEGETKYCLRGLEKYTREGTDKYIQRNNSRANDLYILRMTGANSDEIATIMRQHSLLCVAEAQERARQDALAASRYQHYHHHQQQRLLLPRKQQQKQNQGSDSTHPSWPNLLPIIRTIRDQRAI